MISVLCPEEHNSTAVARAANNSQSSPLCRHHAGMASRGISGRKSWGRMMIKLIIDVVLFSCMFAFVTGIVLAGAHVLG